MSIAAARESRDERLEELKVTFDADELASFFDCFAQLEVDEADFPLVDSGPPEQR